MPILSKKTSPCARIEALETWIKTQFALPCIELMPITNDASFRQYYRCTIKGSAYIVMDAPPDKENISEFIKITNLLSQAPILVPELIAYDITQGFIILSDFGDTWLLTHVKNLTPRDITECYHQALNTIIDIQKITHHSGLPHFNAQHMELEWSYFTQWFLDKLLKLRLTDKQCAMLDNIKNNLIHSAQQEPQVVIHRDFHSRNIMVLPDQRLGIIDYQDAMIGPMSYDVVSLLKDCYIVWPSAQVNDYLSYFYEKKCEKNNQTSKNTPQFPSFIEFKQAFEYMGLQRHFKVLGIFSRLKLRDNKAQYINDIPRIIQYILSVLGQGHYTGLWAEFHDFFVQNIVPAFQQYQISSNSILGELLCEP